MSIYSLNLAPMLLLAGWLADWLVGWLDAIGELRDVSRVNPGGKYQKYRQEINGIKHSLYIYILTALTLQLYK